ncbi:conserved hypothetical protein [Gammaproteobacteria bacterium]
MLDLHSGVVYKNALPAQTQTNSDTAFTGETIDLAGYRGAEFVINTGTITDTDVTCTTILQHDDAANMGTAETVTAALGLVGSNPTIAAASDAKCFRVGYNGSKRYVRLLITPSGNNSGALPIAAVVCLKPMKQVEAQPA